MSALKQIKDFKGIHSGRRLFILASGPSLATLDLAPLSKRLVMGLNRSFMLFPDTHYHCCMDQRLFDLYPSELKKTRYLFTLEGRSWGIPLKLLGSEGFSQDLTQGIYSGYTISYLAMQVAIYMGFSELVYLGLDLKHSQGNTHFFGKDFHSRNHEEAEFPRMKRMLEQGGEAAKDLGVKIYTCSPVSELKNFSQVTFEQAIAL